VHAGGHRFGIRTGLLLLIATGLIWGTIGICGRLVFDRTELDAVEVSWLRTLFAAPFCFLAGLRTLGRALFRVSPRDLAIIVLLAATIFAFQFLYLIGVDAIGVSVATLICLCSIPILVALASAALFGEHPSALVVAALAGAVGGTALLTIGQGGAGGEGRLWTGVAASLASAIGATIYTLGSRVIVQRYSPIVPLALGFPVTLVLFAPVMRGGHVSTDIPISAWLLLFYLGVGTQGIAYLLFQRGLQTESATVASIVTLLEPMLAAVLAWIMFDERLGLTGVLGAGMLIGALSVLTFGDRFRRVGFDHPAA
jgi:DME family drug/metabolite transporter